MNRFISARGTFLAFILTGLLLAPAIIQADDKGTEKKALKPQGTISGLMVDFKNDYITVQLDDQDEPTKFLYGPGITLQSLTKRGIFPVDRVNVKYKTDGDDKKVLAIEKVAGKASGVIIGKVIKVYNNFWVAVKPANGMIEGFALNGPGVDKTPGFTVLKSLNPGDQVAIKYATDFERHRILQIEVKPAPAK
ncbi:MAG TPA: hypothetical protein VFE47_19190 [Tepidisphaeraceae bacterium]|jgi:hypothetical protein|nr:hypothetical protein [Tepidisphaeraceae bacterium]